MSHSTRTMRWDAVQEAFQLSPCQLEVLQLLHDGLPNKQIACRLRRSIHTIDSHRREIYSKVGEHRLDQVLLKVVRVGLSWP